MQALGFKTQISEVPLPIPIQSVIHVNINCSNLENSLPFYRDFVGLEAASHTHPVPQDGAGFGMHGPVQWDAHILHDARGYEGPGLDLLEWKQPLPVGRPPAEPNHVGFFRIGVLVPNLDDLYASALAQGIPCASEPLEVPLEPGMESPVRAFLCRDPDGSAIEFIGSPHVSGPQLIHANVNCSDLERSLEWYERVLGLETRGTSAPGPVPGRILGMKGSIDWDARMLWPPGQGHFAIDLFQWKTPGPIGAPPTRANQLGLYRMAFAVDDIHACHEEIRTQGVVCPPPVFLDMGPDIPIDGVWALFFPDPDGTCMELIETPKL